MGEDISQDRIPPAEEAAIAASDLHAWHAMPTGLALQLLKSRSEGLTAQDAKVRLGRCGANVLPESAKTSIATRILHQLNNPLIYVLLASAVVTALLGHVIDTIVIAMVVFLNGLIGLIQEGKAEDALSAIRKMLLPKATVLRDGYRIAIDATDVVPGDIVLLEPGSRVAADLRLLRVRNLHIDESALTGESIPVEKFSETVPTSALIADRTSMAFSGSLVTSGHGTGLAVATGVRSQLGRISTLLAGVESLETPLIRQMSRFAWQLSAAIVVFAAVSFVFAAVVRDYTVADAFMIVVAMTVAAIPEGLPAVMTITLAIGVQRMASRSAIVRRLPAVETLGSVSTICTDKTGTLTRNEMTATKVVTSSETFDVGGSGYEPFGSFSIEGRYVEPATHPALERLLRFAMLCNDAVLRDDQGNWRVEGDPLEGALIVLGRKAGLEPAQLAKSYPRLDEIPFDAAYRYMATLHHDHRGHKLICVKGAPEHIFSMCRLQGTNERDMPLEAGKWEVAANELAVEGHRVIAIASRRMEEDRRELGFADVLDNLTLEGLIGLIDPPRAGVLDAISDCRSAGIDVKMITGDHAVTAEAIARQIGLRSPEAVVTGAEIDQLTDAALRKRVARSSVYARASPEHKLRLVEALQSDGSVVAMTGDGVNDAPALKRADVGVAMGKGGTETAKEAAEIVLADDNFTTIVAAVREGRTVYDNLVKVIGWTLPTSGAETMIVVIAILLGLILPVTPVQILSWINMVTAVGLGLVLAFEPGEADIMRRPPRSSNAPLLSGVLIWRALFVSMLFTAAAFGLFSWALSGGRSVEDARTIVVNGVVMMEIAYLFSVRYLSSTSLTWHGVLGTPVVLLGVGSVVVLQLAFTYLAPLQILFDTRPTTLLDNALVIVTSITLFAILEIEKVALRTFRRMD